MLLALAIGGCGNRQEPAGTGPRNEAAKPAPTRFDPSTLGEVNGTIRFEGAAPRPQRIVMDDDPACEQNQRGPVFAEDGAVNPDGTLPNAFVYVKSGAEKFTFAAPPAPVVLEQQGCMYQPHVLGIMAGQIMQIVTRDGTTHNIHPMPRNNREWNMSQAPGAPAIAQRFARPEIMIPVKCNQHPWMRAWIGVVSNPFFSVSDHHGLFALKGLPPGSYSIETWTATFGSQVQQVTLGAKQSKTLDFKFHSSP